MTNNPSAIDPLRPVKRRASYLTVPFATLCLASVPFTVAQAADGTYQKIDGNGNWVDTINWSNGAVASGIDATATFVANTSGTDRAVTLPTSLTVGNLIFGSATSSTGSWILNSGTLTLEVATGSPTITVNSFGSSKAVFINSAISSSQGLIKDGSGTLILTGSNSLGGTTTVKAGTLDVRNSNAVGDVNLTATSATLALGATATVTLNGNISGSGKLLVNNSNANLTLAGNGNYSGGLTLSAGHLYIGTGTNYGLGTGTLTINGGSIETTDNASRLINNTLAFGNSTSGLRFGALEGATTGKGDLTFAGTVSASLGGSRTWTVNNSTTVAFNNSWTGNTGWNVTKAGTGTLVFNGGIATTNSVGVIVSAGTLTLNGATNSYSGATTVNNGGTLVVNGSKSGAGAITINAGGTLQLGNGGSLTGAITNDGNFTVSRSVDASQGTHFANAISGSGAFTQAGSGTTTLSSANTYSGGTTISAGTLNVTGSLADAGVVTVNGGTYNVGADDTVGAVTLTSGTISGSGVLSGSSYAVQSGTVSGKLGGTGALTKTTAGTVTLSGVNTYTGATSISAGTLALSSGASLASTSISVASGAVFTNNGTVSGVVTVEGTLTGAGTFSGTTTIMGTHSPGNSPEIQTFNNLAYDGATVNWELTQNTATQGSPAVFDQVIVLGNLSFAGLTTLNLSFNTSGSTVDWADSLWGSNQSWLLFDVAGTTTGFGNLTVAGTGLLDASGDDFGTFLPGSNFSLSLNGNDVYLNYTASAIPEPSTYAAIAGALALGAVLIRRRRRAQAQA